MSGGLRQDESRNTSEDTEETESVQLRQNSKQEPEVCITEAISEPTPLKWRGWKKRPAPHCHICDPEIRKECDNCEENKCEEPFHRRSKNFRVACIFYGCRVGGRQGTQHGGKLENGCAHAQQN